MHGEHWRTEGGSVPSRVGYREGCPLPSRLGGLGSVMSCPSRVGAEPWPKTDFSVFWRPQNAPFCTYMTKSERDNLNLRPLLQVLRGLVLPTPMIYAHGYSVSENFTKIHLQLLTDPLNNRQKDEQMIEKIMHEESNAVKPFGKYDSNLRIIRLQTLISESLFLHWTSSELPAT